MIKLTRFILVLTALVLLVSSDFIVLDAENNDLSMHRAKLYTSVDAYPEVHAEQLVDQHSATIAVSMKLKAPVNNYKFMSSSIKSNRRAELIDSLNKGLTPWKRNLKIHFIERTGNWLRIRVLC